MKGRDRQKAMILIAADLLQVNDLVENIPPVAEVLIENFWPGPLTLVFDASSRLQEFAFKKSKTIAVRVPDSPISLALLKACGFPLVSTSANKSGGAEATNAQEVIKNFGKELDVIVDGGETPSRIPSTVVDITKTPLKIIREGAISVLEINTVLEIGLL